VLRLCYSSGHGWKKPGLKKTSPVGFLGFVLGYFGFWVILNILAQKREFFRVFSVSRILLGSSRL
jgi:hypothetical protein